LLVLLFAVVVILLLSFGKLGGHGDIVGSVEVDPSATAPAQPAPAPTTAVRMKLEEKENYSKWKL